MSESKLNATWKDGKLTVSADFAEKPAAVMLRGDGIRAGIQLTTRATSYTVDFPADNQRHTVACKPFPGIPGFDGEAEFFAGEPDAGYTIELKECTSKEATIGINHTGDLLPGEKLTLKVHLLGSENNYMCCYLPVSFAEKEIKIAYNGAFGIGINLIDAETGEDIADQQVKLFE